ncbi:MAG: flagellin N-terminal helical domain-containing protein [Planctomycetota bacterium]|jgi:flagellin-like hook-associated protein FlgL
MGSFSVTTPRVSDTLRAQLILGNLNNSAVQLLRLQNQLSSGRRVIAPSDEPFDAAVAGKLQNFLEQKSRFQKNIENATGVLSTADAALGQASELVTQARTTGLEEIGVIATAETRRSAAAIIEEILSEFVSLGNTKFTGRYIFAGRDTLTAPFEVMDEGVYFGGDTGTVDVSIDYSSTSSTSVDASAAFGAVSTEVLARNDLDPIVTLDTLLSDLNGGRGVRPGTIIINDSVNVSTIDLSGAKTIRDLINAINAGTPPATTVSIQMAGKALQINAPGGSLTVLNALGGSTATDLGIYRPTPVGPMLVGDDIDPVITPLTLLAAMATTDWASGLRIENGSLTQTVDFTGCNTVQDVLNRINNAGLYLEARINETGTGIDIVNRLSGGALKIGENGGATATDLGIRTMALSTPLSQLNSGRAVTSVSGDDITITLKDATVFGVDLSSAVTIGDVINAINTAPGNPGTLVAGLAATGNGIELTDSSGGAGNLVVDRANLSNAAVDLGILGSTAGAVITGTDVSAVEPDGILTHLVGLKKALLANDDGLISFYTDKIENDLPTILERRASIGARQQRMDTVRDRISSEVLELQSLLSDRIDLDYATSIVKFSTLEAAFEAGLQTAGSFLRMSLIDFLR